MAIIDRFLIGLLALLVVIIPPKLFLVLIGIIYYALTKH